MAAVVKNQGTKQREQRSLADCWQWKANGQSSKGDNCSFRHDMNKRATAESFSELFHAAECENASRTRNPGGRSPSGKMARLPCKDYLKGTCTTPFCEKWHPPECLFTSHKKDADLGKSALMHTGRLKISPAKTEEEW